MVLVTKPLYSSRDETKLCVESLYPTHITRVAIIVAVMHVLYMLNTQSYHVYIPQNHTACKFSSQTVSVSVAQ
jgi:hypothetical protein